jgi:uracil permease
LTNQTPYHRGFDYHFGKDPKIDANRGLDMIPNLHEDTSYADDEE